MIMVPSFLKFLILAAGTNQMPQMGMSAPAGPQANPMAGQDPDKLFRAEAENLELVQHEYLMDGIEQRLANITF